MSGTSLDGVDAAWLETDGATHISPGPCHTTAYPADFRARLRAILGRDAPDAETRAVEADLTRSHADAVAALIAVVGRPPDLIGFHGQTIYHAPARRFTWQIGDGALLARLTGVPVVADFRSADVAAGGQGAPLVPLYHEALVAALPRPLAVLNIGGVANITLLPAVGPPLAFDTGPGVALLDDWVREKTGQNYDQDGALVRAGTVAPALLAAWLTQEYFSRPAPKSLDRDAFAACLPMVRAAGLSAADGAATLAAFTGAAVAAGCHLAGVHPQRLLVTGGGRHHPGLMQELATRLSATAACAVQPVEAVGWDGDALEAQAFAWLAVRSRLGLPLSLPSTTGAPNPMTGGRFFMH